MRATKGKESRTEFPDGEVEQREREIRKDRPITHVFPARPHQLAPSTRESQWMTYAGTHHKRAPRPSVPHRHVTLPRPRRTHLPPAATPAVDRTYRAQKAGALPRGRICSPALRGPWFACGMSMGGLWYNARDYIPRVRRLGVCSVEVYDLDLSSSSTLAHSTCSVEKASPVALSPPQHPRHQTRHRQGRGSIQRYCRYCTRLECGELCAE